MIVKVREKHSKTERTREIVYSGITKYLIEVGILSLYKENDITPLNGIEINSQSDSSDGEWKVVEIWIMNDQGQTIEKIK